MSAEDLSLVNTWVGLSTVKVGAQCVPIEMTAHSTKCHVILVCLICWTVSSFQLKLLARC